MNDDHHDSIIIGDNVLLLHFESILNNLIHALQKMIGKFHQTTTIKRILSNLHLGIDHQSKTIRFQFDPINVVVETTQANRTN